MIKIILALAFLVVSIQIMAKGRKYVACNPLPDSAIQETWEKIGTIFKWGSVFICFAAAIIYQSKVSKFIKYPNHDIDGPDFILWMMFLIIVIPAIFMVITSMYMHFKYDAKAKTSMADTAFVIISAVSIIVPFVLLYVSNKHFGVLYSLYPQLWK